MEGREEKTCITIQILIPAPNRTFIASNLLIRWNINPIMEWLKLTVPESPKPSLIVSFWIMRFGKFLIPVDCLCLILGFLAWWNAIDLTWNWQGRKCHTFWRCCNIHKDCVFRKMQLRKAWQSCDWEYSLYRWWFCWDDKEEQQRIERIIESMGYSI